MSERSYEKCKGCGGRLAHLDGCPEVNWNDDPNWRPKPEAPTASSYREGESVSATSYSREPEPPPAQAQRKWFAYIFKGDNERNNELFSTPKAFHPGKQDEVIVIEYAAYDALEKDWERLNIKCGDYSLENERLEHENKRLAAELKEARELYEANHG